MNLKNIDNKIHSDEKENQELIGLINLENFKQFYKKNHKIKETMAIIIIKTRTPNK